MYFEYNQQFVYFFLGPSGFSVNEHELFSYSTNDFYFIYLFFPPTESEDEYFCDNMASSDAIPLPSSLNIAQDITQAERETSPTSHAHPAAISQAAIFLTLVASLLKQLF